jgi:hypothetical protein
MLCHCSHAARSRCEPHELYALKNVEVIVPQPVGYESSSGGNGIGKHEDVSSDDSSRMCSRCRGRGEAPRPTAAATLRWAAARAAARAAMVRRGWRAATAALPWPVAVFGAAVAGRAAGQRGESPSHHEVRLRPKRQSPPTPTSPKMVTVPLGSAGPHPGEPPSGRRANPWVRAHPCGGGGGGEGEPYEGTCEATAVL